MLSKLMRYFSSPDNTDEVTKLRKEIRLRQDEIRKIAASDDSKARAVVADVLEGMKIVAVD